MSRETGIGRDELFHAGILYVNLPLFRACVAASAASQRLTEIPRVQTVEHLAENLGGLQVWCSGVLSEAKLHILPFNAEDLTSQHALQLGDLRSFQFCVRTRGVGCRGVEKNKRGEIYRKVKGSLLRLPIDSAWIAGNHGYAKLRSGNASLCGIFSVRQINSDNNSVVGEPIILGEPVSDFFRLISPERCSLLCRSAPI